MKIRKKIGTWLIIIGVLLSFILLIFFINKYCTWTTCFMKNTSREVIVDNIKEIGEKNIDIKPIVITPKIKFNDKCNKIKNKENLLDFIEDEEIVISDKVKTIITEYIDNKINKSTLENKLLEIIWDTDQEESIQERLYLNSLFLIINNLDRWNPIKCEDMFNQYNK